MAPLTLVYGQNSAGKSTIHDALEFIHGFFDGSWDKNTISAYLERWANYKRTSEPLTKGYLGKHDDVVLSLSSITGDQDYFEWEATYHPNQDFVEEGLPHNLFVHSLDTKIPFRIDIHFSNRQGDWHVRQFSLYLGDDICLELIFDDFENHEHILDEYGLLKINRNHLVYALLDSFFEGQQELFVMEDAEEGDLADDWFLYNDMDITYELGWQKPISWTEVDNSSERPSYDVLEFRTFLLALLQVPTKGIARNFAFNSVPPLRPIPAKQDAVYRRFSELGNKSSDWSELAEQVCLKHIYDSFPVESDGENDVFKNRFEQLEQINRILSHPLFLNTDYELTGECLFLAPIEMLKDVNKPYEELRDRLEQLDAEIHLKLLHKSTGCLTEIEDVGVGISQIIPVLAAISRRDEYLTCSYRAFIQQPELHLHPKLQSQLADAFIECINKNVAQGDFPSFVVESHSEHFLLRLLRRIRETHSSDIKNKLFSLSPTDVSVLYVDKLADGSSKIFPLRISPEGEFIDRWPGGFFSDRDRDLGLLDE